MTYAEDLAKRQIEDAEHDLADYKELFEVEVERHHHTKLLLESQKVSVKWYQDRQQPQRFIRWLKYRWYLIHRRMFYVQVPGKPWLWVSRKSGNAQRFA